MSITFSCGNRLIYLLIRFSKRREILICMLILLFGGFINSGYTDRETFSVSPAGLDSPETDGLDRPWQSVGYALARIPEAGGVVIRVEPGTYSPIITTRRFQQPVVIRSTEPYRAIILPASGSGAILLNGASNLLFDGLTIDNQSNSAVSNALQVLSGASGVTVRNCMITHGNSGYANAHAIKINRDVQDVTIDGNVIYNAMDELVELSDRVHDVTLSRNVLYQEDSRERKPLTALYDYVWRITIGGNVFINRNNGENGYTIQAGRGIGASQDVREVVAVNNTFIQGEPLKPFCPPEWDNMLFLGNLTNEKTVFFSNPPDAGGVYRFGESPTHRFDLFDAPLSLDELQSLSDSVKKQDLRMSDYFRLSGIPDSLRGLIIEMSERLYRLDHPVNQ